MVCYQKSTRKRQTGAGTASRYDVSAPVSLELESGGGFNNDHGNVESFIENRKDLHDRRIVSKYNVRGRSS